MKDKEIKQLESLYKKYSSQKQKTELALSSLMKRLEEVTGKEIQHTEFPGDGLGVVAGDSSIHTYMSFFDALSIIREKGTIDYDEFTYL